MIRKLQLVLALSGSALSLLLLAIQSWSPVPAVTAATHHAAPTAITAITCTGDYTAEVFFSGLSSPDGLAMDAAGILYVSEESIGTVSRIEGGTRTEVLSGLINPEGIAFDGTGNLYVVEDRENGRLIRRSPDGTVITLTEGLLTPEGVQVGADGTIYVTESSLQTLSNNDPADLLDQEYIDNFDFSSFNFATADSATFDVLTDTLLSRLTAFAPTAPFTPTVIITHRPEITPNFTQIGGNLFNPIMNLEVESEYLSFAGITIGSDNHIYISLDLSNIEVMSDTVLSPPFVIDNPPAPFSSVTIQEFSFSSYSTQSVIRVDPTTGISITFASSLTTTEESRFQSSGAYPMYIIEEDVTGLANGAYGRLSIITETNGIPETFCDGLRTIEDVLIAPDGTIYVTEDFTGSIIKISSPSCVAPDPSTVSSLGINYNNGISLTWSAVNQNELDVMVWQSSADPYFEQPGLSCQYSGDCSLFTSGTTYNPQVENGGMEFYLMSTISSCGATNASPNRMGQFGYSLEPGS